MTKIQLHFSGYGTENQFNLLPSVSGIYCVYSGVPVENNKVDDLSLLYIGESENINSRLISHEKKPEWKKALRFGTNLYFSFCLVNTEERLQTEAALINKHKPTCNLEYKWSFPFESLSITITGDRAKLYPSFTIFGQQTLEAIAPLGLFSLPNSYQRSYR